jgi:hypothetical protein
VKLAYPETDADRELVFKLSISSTDSGKRYKQIYHGWIMD